LDQRLIRRLEVSHLFFEFAFPGHLRQDGGGGKGFQISARNFYLPSRTGIPRLSRISDSLEDTSLCPGK
jgi:hypothetical protein